MDEINVEAAAGLLEVQIQIGDLDAAAGQIFFLHEMFSSTAALLAKRQGRGDDGLSSREAPGLLYLKGLLAWKQDNIMEVGSAL